jgi:hypothetical protein
MLAVALLQSMEAQFHTNTTQTPRIGLESRYQCILRVVRKDQGLVALLARNGYSLVYNTGT